ncbi:oligoendopeptidase F [bacterium]|nr:oligoendopeptidase F [bacterium]
MKTGIVKSQTRSRQEVSQEYKWNLSDIFQSDESWQKAKDEFIKKMDGVVKYKSRLASSSKILLECLEFNSSLEKEFSRLYSYSSMKSDEDTRNSKYLGFRQEMSQIGTEYSAKAAFIEPEIAAVDKEVINNFLRNEQGLRKYEMYLNDIFRRKAHKLSEKEERILALAGMITDGSYTIYSIFSNAEMPYPEVKLHDGTIVKIDQAGFSRYRALANREDRIIVFEKFWENYKKFKSTLGAGLYTNVKKDMFYAKSRGYKSSLEAALDVNNISVSVYISLINNVNKNIETLYRYLKIKKRLLKVDTLHYYDLYAPAVKSVDLEFSYDQARQIVIDALKPLGEEYLSVVNRAFIEKWIDVYPTTGKRSGAYSNDGGYDVHPYMLLNYNGKYNDVSTLIHEMGHSMHTYLSNKNQPFPTADYSIFVAEVASTLNEALLMNKMLSEIEDSDIRLSLLMEYLDGVKGTLFRQTQFAEFELKIHEKAEKGEPLTGDALTEIYIDMLKRYYGHDKGFCFIDDMAGVEWAYIPHFYYNFYVYQYATSFTASTALALKVINKEKGAKEKVIKFLSAGCSEYPIDVLKVAGVDMNSLEPFDLTVKYVNNVMDEIEKILAERGE